jgi:hypothetical protein
MFRLARRCGRPTRTTNWSSSRRRARRAGRVRRGDLLASKPVALDPAKDKAGPLDAVAREFPRARRRPGRLVVIGDLTSCATATSRRSTTATCSERDELAHGQRGVRHDRPQAPAGHDGEPHCGAVRELRFMALFLLPEAILMLGIVNWWRRKT